MSKGIDIPIDNLVADFTSHLWTGKTNWFTGRCFRNERFGSFPSVVCPEVFDDDAKAYKELLKDYRKDSQCFFDVQPNDDINGTEHTSIVWIVFFLDLTKVFPTLTREDATEEAHRNVLEIVRLSSFNAIGLVRGFEAVNNYDWGNNASQAKADMNEHYCFRVNTNIEYSNC